MNANITPSEIMTDLITTICVEVEGKVQECDATMFNSITRA